MRAIRIVLLALAATAAAAQADDEGRAYPPGRSAQRHEDLAFELLVPRDRDPARPASLLLVVATGTTLDPLVERLQPLVDRGFVVCLPRPDYRRGGSTSHARHVIDLVDHLAAALPVAADRVHCLAIDDPERHALHVAFAAGARFAGVCIVEPKPWSMMPPLNSVPRGVLVYGARDPILGALRSKVPQAEFRAAEKDPLAGPRLPWWLGMMEGRFVPGDDLSLNWIDPPSPETTLKDVKARLADRATGGLLYFHAADDATDAGARRLQSEVLRDAGVRDAARAVCAWKFDRLLHAPLFHELGLEGTPVLVIVDAEFRTVATFGPQAKAEQVAKALRGVGRAAPPSDGAFPPGASRHEWKGRSFQMLLPDAGTPPRELSLVLAIHGDLGEEVVPDLTHLPGHGFAVCAPEARSGWHWAANEGEELIDLADHVARTLKVPDTRLHVVARGHARGFATQIAFHRKARFAGACFVDCGPSGARPPADARRRLGVLSLGAVTGGTNPAPSRKIADDAAPAVRVAEYRRDAEDLGGPYLLWWLRAMEGRFTPGDDLSFDWRTPGSAPEVTKAVQDAGRPTLVWFFSAADATDEVARALQTQVFLEAGVRATGRPLQAIRLAREAHGELFGLFELKRTPALVVVDTSLRPLARFEGAVDPADLARALERANPSTK